MTTTIITRGTITQEVYDHLKGRIVDGALQPGTRLIIDNIASKFGVSLTPVRESLRLLEKDRLVRNVPHRGAIVVGLTRRQFEDMFAVRRVNEGLAARLACRQADERYLTRIEATVSSMDEAIAANDARALADADRNFHRTLAAASGNAAVQQIIDGLTVRIQAFFSVTVGDLSGGLGDPSRSLQGRAEHAAILDAVRQADADAAERLMLEHLDHSLQRATESGKL